jgi:hypothetical protein
MPDGQPGKVGVFMLLKMYKPILEGNFARAQLLNKLEF